MENSEKFYLTQLTLENFRCFDYVTINFDPRLTVFVAPNGGGKTAILDAVEIAFRLFVDSLLKKHAATGFRQQDIRLILDSEWIMHPMLPLSFSAEAIIFGQPTTWSRTLESFQPHAKTTSKEAVELKYIAIKLNKQIDDYIVHKTNVPPLLPLLGYYGTGRLWAVHKLTDKKISPKIAPNSRYIGYEDCLTSLSSYKSFKSWFENMSREQQQEKEHNKQSPHNPTEKLKAVKKAIDQVLSVSGWKNLEWDFQLNTIRATHLDYGFLPIEALSDGIRNMIGMVADIAHRAVRLNPHLGENAIEQTPGVVLIDEVDMHLHPEWQQRVIPALLDAFPKIQFIVTTHSPQVISTVHASHIRLININNVQSSIDLPDQQTRGVESAAILAHVFGSDPIPQVEEAQWVSDYRALIETGKANSDEAQALKVKLVTHFGENHPVLLECNSLIKIQDFRKKLGNAGESNNAST